MLISRPDYGIPVNTRTFMFQATHVIQQIRLLGASSPPANKPRTENISHNFHLVTQDSKNYAKNGVLQDLKPLHVRCRCRKIRSSPLLTNASYFTFRENCVVRVLVGTIPNCSFN